MISCHCVLRSRRRGNQYVSLQKCANFVIVRTDLAHARHTILRRESTESSARVVVIEFVIDALR